jgi:hypothetical protein
MAASTGAIGAQPPAPPDTSQEVSDTPQILKVFVRNDADVQRLSAMDDIDPVEGRGDDHLLVVGDKTVGRRLRRAGFRVQVERELEPLEAFVDAANADATARVFGGYHSVAEHRQHLTDVAAARPDLAVTVDIGDSWKKAAGLGGNDLQAICLTKQNAGDCQLNPTSAKPRFLLISAIHARELTPAEMAYRWIDHLVAGYGNDPEVSWLMDHVEMWVVPLVNPDGREIVESGGTVPYLQRKNANNTAPGSAACANPPSASSQAGVDLNRNSSTPNWGGAGTSTNPCAQTYLGVAPASEPETQAIQGLLSSLFADTKGPNRIDAASASTRGVMVTLHSYSNFVLFPYGDAKTGGYAPNDAGLRSLAFRMTYFNGYKAGTGDEILYPTTGTTDDWTYGTLGVPSFTFELGPTSGTCSGFTPAYSCMDSVLWPQNLPALMYAAKAARDPYVSALGPTTTGVTASAGSVASGATFTLSAVGRDNAYGTSGPGAAGRPNPTAQRVTAARYSVDAPPWVATSTPAMAASDGRFSSTAEAVRATVSTAGWAPGRHTLYVQTRDVSGAWGPPTATYVTVT